MWQDFHKTLLSNWVFISSTILRRSSPCPSSSSPHTWKYGITLSNNCSILLGNDDQVCVGALVDFLDRVVQDSLHVDLPQRLDDRTILRTNKLLNTQSSFLTWLLACSLPACRGASEDPIVWQSQLQTHSQPLCRSCRGRWNAKKKWMTFAFVQTTVIPNGNNVQELADRRDLLPDVSFCGNPRH